MISRALCAKFWLACGALFIAGVAVGLGEVTVKAAAAKLPLERSLNK